MTLPLVSFFSILSFVIFVFLNSGDMDIYADLLVGKCFSYVL